MKKTLENNLKIQQGDSLADSLIKRLNSFKKIIKPIPRDKKGQYGNALNLDTILKRIDEACNLVGISFCDEISDYKYDPETNLLTGVLTIYKYNSDNSNDCMITRHLFIGARANLKMSLENINFMQGKALTYSRKYAYLQSFGLSANDKDGDEPQNQNTYQPQTGGGKPKPKIIIKKAQPKADDIFKNIPDNEFEKKPIPEKDNFNTKVESVEKIVNLDNQPKQDQQLYNEEIDWDKGGENNG